MSVHSGKNEIDTAADISTRDKLLQTGVHLFAKYGFDATSTRMIAQAAGTNIATMPFHFGNKENYYCEVLNYMAGQIGSRYAPLRERINQMVNEHTLSSEHAWPFIEEYIDLVLSVVSTLKETDSLSLLFHEQNRPPFGEYPISHVVCKEGECLLKVLLLAYWDSQEEKKAAAISRIINGSLITLVEHPVFMRQALDLENGTGLPTEIIEVIRAYTLNSIRSYSL